MIHYYSLISNNYKISNKIQFEIKDENTNKNKTWAK